MKILLTNDDGFDSPGLECLRGNFKGHELWTMAPDGDRSGKSHAITLRKPLKMKKISERNYTCSGNPADCVLYVLAGALPLRPDLVISGINLGPNLGTDLVYSGTAAAARQAAFSGIPGMAVSTASFDPNQDFQPIIDFMEANLEKLVRLWTPDLFININFPADNANPAGVIITRPARRTYKDRVDSFVTKNGDTYLFLSGEIPEAPEDMESDWGAVGKGNISISPIFLHPVNHEEEQIFKNEKFQVKK